MNVEAMTRALGAGGFGNTRQHRNTPAVLLIQPPAWTVDALCAQTDPEAFYPEKGGSTRQAKRVCDACPVRLECLAYALEHDERDGVWGGLSPRQRQALKRAAVAA